MNRRLLMVGLSAFVFSALTFAQQVEPDTSLPPADLVMRSIEATPEVTAAEAVLERASAEQRQRNVGPHEVQLVLIPQTRQIDGEGRYREWEADISRGVRWPRKARLDREIGAAGYEAAQLMLEDAHHTAARHLLTLWSDWQRAGIALDLRRKQVELWQRDAAALDRRVQLGDAARLDLITVRAALAQAQAASLQAEADQTLARLALSTAFPDLPLPDAVHLPTAPSPLHGSDDEWTARILSRSHEIGAAQAQYHQKDAEAQRARADRLPDPIVGLRALSDRGGRERALGVSVSIPIGVSYRSAEAAAAGADALGAQAQLAMVNRDVRQGARQVVAMARARYDIWQRQHDANTAASMSAEKTARAYALGEAGLSDVLAARRMAQDAALADQSSAIDAIEAVTRVQVDSHERWHAHDAGDEEHEAAGSALPSLGQ